MDGIMEELEKQFCPPLDPALLSAILSDYDLDNPDHVTQARRTLDELKATAEEQEASGFDPTGLASQSYVADATEQSDHTESGRTELTDLTSISGGLRSLDLDSASRSENGEKEDIQGFLRDMENLDAESKALRLQEIFSQTSATSCSLILKKCDGNFNRAFDELLNHAYFAEAEAANGEDKILSKGIDAFSEDNIGRRGRARRKKQRATRLSLQDGDFSSTSVSPSPGPAVSVWRTGHEDVDFIAKRMKLSESVVAPAYQQSQRSRGRTIAMLIDDLNKRLDKAKAPEDDVKVISQAFDLQRDFPSVPAIYLTTIIRITQPSVEHARDLAAALDSPHRTPPSGSLEVIPKYKAVDLTESDSDTGPWTSAAQRAKPARVFAAGTSSAALATQYGQARNRLLAQASAAYRRGKSDPRMMAAAGYYSQESRDFAALSREAAGRAADELVDSNSTATQVDLHGVTVKDAQRIVRQKLESWERATGRRVMGLDGRMVNEGASGPALSIITGLGRHSVGGQSKLTPAVRKILDDAGYKYVYNEGVYVVTMRKAR